MRAVRYFYVLALALWLGGMALAALVVAPTIFSVLDSWNAANGRVLAGSLFGEILRRVYLVGGVAGGVMLLTLTVQRVLVPRPKAYGDRASIIALMLAATGYAALALQPQINALQLEASGPISRLSPDDARHTSFDQLHRWSTALMSLTMLGGVVLLTWETRE